MFAIFEGVEKLLHPHELESPQWAIGILLVAIVLEASSFRTAVRESNPLRRGASWAEFIRRSKAPELPVLLLEDSGALIGLVIALAAVGMSMITGSGVWDGVGSTLIGLLLGGIAIVLGIEMKSLLIGESASPDDQLAIVGAIEADAQVRGLIHLRTEHIGPEELLVGAKIDFDPALTMPELALGIDRVEAAIRTAVPSARVIYLEPDIARSTSRSSPESDSSSEPGPEAAEPEPDPTH